MSDEFYRQRAARRGRMYWIIKGIILVFVCVIAGVMRAYQDSCTGSLDTVGQNYPWKHWHIIYGTFGGTVIDPWCK